MVYPKIPKDRGKTDTHAKFISMSYRYRGSVVRIQTQKKTNRVLTTNSRALVMDEQINTTVNNPDMK